MDALALARWQFGITTVYHFFFVPMTIGLIWLVAVMQTRWMRTGDERWLKLTKLFGKLFLINFAAGVVTGIVQEFQFGMNWSEYSRFVGDIFGAPLALEALIAFFMESTFVGLWIFGWDRLPKKVHLAMAYLTAAGSTISAIFILAANSWMQNPVGAIYNAQTNRAELDNFLALIGNPFFLTTFPHTLAAAAIISAGLVAGVSGWWLIKARAAAGEDAAAAKVADDTWRSPTRMGAWILLVACIAAILSGHFMAQVEAKYQPAKLAASEAVMKTTDHAPLSLLAVPDGKGGAKDVIAIPGLLSWMSFNSTSATVAGMDDIRAEYAKKVVYQINNGTKLTAPEGGLQLSCQKNDLCITRWAYSSSTDPIPNWFMSYYAFRVMVALAGIGLIFSIILLYGTRSGKTPKPGKGWTAMFVALPLLPLVANTAGWILAEIGRQPWIVYGVVATSSANSPTVSGPEIFITMALYTLIYLVVAVLVVRLFLQQIRHGAPEVAPAPESSDDAPLAFAY